MLLVSSCGKQEGDEFAYLYENLPFKMEKVARPSIPDLRVNIKDFGGVGDGVTLNTEALEADISTYRRGFGLPAR